MRGLCRASVPDALDDVRLERGQPARRQGAGLPVRVYHSSAPVYWITIWARPSGWRLFPFPGAARPGARKEALTGS